jgi:hypothetical protein
MVPRIPKIKILVLKRLLLLLSLALCAQALASDPIADATAKFLAGLPVKGTPLESRSTNPGWAEHATDLDRAWDRLEMEQLSKIRAWAPQSLGPSYEDRGLLFYMFSGPDFLYANVFFPNASTYILCGIEPVGSVPNIDKIPNTVLPSALASLRKSLDSVLDLSYFITKFMKSDLKQAQLDGTLPVLYIFLARACCTIDSVTRVALDRDGNFVPEDKGTTPGVKIIFFGPSGREQTLYYFTSDLMDRATKANPGFGKFCERQGQGVTFLKAAGYYIRRDDFSMVRDFLLAHSKIILQDDSGIPVPCLDSDKWDIRLYKNKVDAESMPQRLEFSFGYRGKQSGSLVMVATPK